MSYGINKVSGSSYHTKPETYTESLNQLTSICMEQLDIEESFHKANIQRLALSERNQNTTDKTQKLFVKHKSGSCTEYTVDENCIPNGRAFYSGYNGTMMDLNFKNGIKDGKVVIYYHDGAIETSEYNNGVREGFSTYQDQNTVSTGILMNGEFVGKVSKKNI